VPLATETRKARAALALTFLLTGAVFATWAARLPALTERLEFSPGEASIALVGVEGGALVGLATAGRLVAAVGSATSLRLGFVVYPAALVATAFAPALGWLAATKAVMGTANSVIDVAMNVQGVELERHCARPLLSRLHSAHSFGVLVGGAGGTLCAARGVPLGAHFAAVAALAIATAQLAAGALLEEPRRIARGRARLPSPREGARRGARRPGRRLAAIGLLACGAFFVEGAANDWSAIHLRSVHGTGPALAGAAFTIFSLTLALGRLGADGLVARHGRARFTRAAATVAALGAAIAAASGSAGVALVGWAVLGLGVAGLAPTLLSAAPGASSAPPAVAIATVSAIGYSGSFAGPPVIGALASVASLAAALGSPVLVAVAITAFAGAALPEADRDAAEG
jgi:Major Facilitator Superfamily